MNRQNNDSPIAIIGGGIAGLVAAHQLSKNGLSVILLEATGKLGGLAGSFDFDGQTIEKFYHFICKTDNDYFYYLSELGIDDQLNWQEGITKFFHEGKMYPFASPFDLIRFTAIPLIGRFRFGINILRDRFHRDWRTFDSISAREWLIKHIGQKAYDVIWDPLLRVKFGIYHDQISAAWIWHRIWRVAKSRRNIWEKEQLGYLNGGTQILVNAIYTELKKSPLVTIHTYTKVSQIKIEDNFITNIVLDNGKKIFVAAIISTIPLSLLKTMITDERYAKILNKYTYIGILCGLLKLKYPITDGFWININDQRIPYNGIIEYTNLNRDLFQQVRASYVYIPFYTRTTHPRFGFSDKELIDEYASLLTYLNSKFDKSWILASHIWRAHYAQAICTTGFDEIKPDYNTPIRGLFITDSTIMYPEDRTINGSIRMGKQVASLVMKDNLNGQNRTAF